MSKEILTNWEKHFNSKGIEEKLRNEYLSYAENLVQNKVPIIFEFNHLALLLGVSHEYLAKVINSKESFYREFSIPKRNGGKRSIRAPYPSLLNTQWWIYNNILKKIKVNECAHGFVEKKSIVTNSRLHLKQNELLKIDLKDFFPSISINRIISIFNHIGYNHQISYYLSAICTLENQLPQGAPTSPYLSNIVAYRLDRRLINFAKKFNLKYTRYADDLTFSGDEIPAKLINYITAIIKNEGFEVNTTKTRLYKNKNTRRIVTGVSVNGDSLSLPKSYKRDLKQELFFIMKYGFDSHVAKLKIRKSNYLNVILGKINYWLMIEPKNEFALKAKEYFKEYCKQKKVMQ